MGKGISSHKEEEKCVVEEGMVDACCRFWESLMDRGWRRSRAVRWEWDCKIGNRVSGLRGLLAEMRWDGMGEFLGRLYHAGVRQCDLVGRVALFCVRRSEEGGGGCTRYAARGIVLWRENMCGPGNV